MSQTRSLLTIAGTDPSGGAGIQVDLQVFRDWGFHGLSVVTAVVCQNTQGVRGFQAVDPEVVDGQLGAILDDVDPAAIKIGMLPTPAVVEVVADALASLQCPVVFDPVMASGSGEQALNQAGTVEAMSNELIAHVDLLTPNVPEARALCGRDIDGRPDLERAARALVDLGAPAVLLKAGHLDEETNTVADFLATCDQARWLAPLERVDADVRGTGCQLSSALAANLAGGLSLFEAVEASRRYLNKVLRTCPQTIGRGRPVVVRADSCTRDDLLS